MSLYKSLFYSSEINLLFADERQVGFLLEAESALALAQSACGIIPEREALVISGCCKVELIDIEKLKEEIEIGGNVAIPLVRQLTQIVRNKDPQAAKYVHFGATSQDIVDTATVLSLMYYMDWLGNGVAALKTILTDLTKKYKNTLMVGRTLLQQAKPITFGLKTALWLESIRRIEQQLQVATSNVLRAQLFGAVGAGNDKLSDKVLYTFASRLGLSSSVSWHSQRDCVVFFASGLGVLNGFLGKIAKDVSLLMQTEIGEVSEGKMDGKGVSSTMPHKRNPVAATVVLSNAARTPQLVGTMLAVMPQEHERSAGFWHAEWETLSDLCRLTAGSLEKVQEMLGGLEVDKVRMEYNLELTKGLIYAENVALLLAPQMGKIPAYELVDSACKIAVQEDKHLKRVLEEQYPNLHGIETCFEPMNAIGNSLEMIDRILKNDNKL